VIGAIVDDRRGGPHGTDGPRGTARLSRPDRALAPAWPDRARSS